MKITGLLLFMLFFQAIALPDLSAQTAKKYALNNLEGEEIHLSNIWGENLTVLDFWASWCKPCMKAIPELIKLSDEFAERGVNFIGINEDSPRNSSKVKPLAFSLGINYPILLDSDQEMMNDLLVNLLPTLLIFNKKGGLF
ncbi:MAG: TlpA family protein disulfide reductase [Chloroflexia bacterium]|nr:TlpA family protein disulfide reductase [Chloroflexia bacterium]